MSSKLFDLSNFDEYNRRARIYPALFTLLPLMLGMTVWFPYGFTGLMVLLSILAWAGIIYFLANIARDFGKQKESYLFELWGGKPTTKFLRYRDTTNDEMQTHLHKKLKTIFPDVTPPTRQEETRNPTKADNIYDIYTRRVIERTRDKKKFGILFGENCSYGFRRNLWGMKNFGITNSLVGSLISITGGVYIYLMSGILSPLAITTTSINLILLLIWVLRVTPQWVRIPAEAYAERLFASLEHLSS